MDAAQQPATKARKARGVWLRLGRLVAIALAVTVCVTISSPLWTVRTVAHFEIRGFPIPFLLRGTGDHSVDGARIFWPAAWVDVLSWGAVVTMLLSLLAAIVAHASRFHRRRRVRAGRCVACAYNLEGNVTGWCPECGEPIIVDPPAASRWWVPFAATIVLGMASLCVLMKGVRWSESQDSCRTCGATSMQVSFEFFGLDHVVSRIERLGPVARAVHSWHSGDGQHTWETVTGSTGSLIARSRYMRLPALNRIHFVSELESYPEVEAAMEEWYAAVPGFETLFQNLLFMWGEEDYEAASLRGELVIELYRRDRNSCPPDCPWHVRSPEDSSRGTD